MTDAPTRKPAPILWAAMILLAVGSLINTFLRPGEPWIWVLVIVQFALLVVLITGLTRFVLAQRDDYWRERGKDPKHPEL